MLLFDSVINDLKISLMDEIINEQTPLTDDYCDSKFGGWE